MNNEQFDRVLNACKAQQAKGAHIIQGDWGVRRDSAGEWQPAISGCLCALGCLLVEEQPQTNVYSEDQEFSAAQALRAMALDIGRFTRGFDEPDEYEDDEDEWIYAGVRMARELGLAPLPITTETIPLGEPVGETLGESIGFDPLAGAEE